MNIAKSILLIGCMILSSISSTDTPSTPVCLEGTINGRPVRVTIESEFVIKTEEPMDLVLRIVSCEQEQPE